MNFGTKLRTILRIVVSVNTAIYAVTAAVNGLNLGWLTIVWTILTIISDFAVSAVTTYFNNDYTEAACRATGAMRLQKAFDKNQIEGENFYDFPEYDLDEEEEVDEDDEDI